MGDDARSEGGVPREVPVLLASIAVLLVGLQYFTLVEFQSMQVAGYASWELFLEAARANVALGWLDGVLAVLTLATLLVLLEREVRGNALTHFLGYVFGDERRTRLFLVLSCLLLVRYYFAAGELSWRGDASAHIAYADIAAHSVAQFELPIWTNFLGGGTPYLQFYGFLFFYLVGLVDLLCGDVYLAIKGILAAAHLASGMGMYLWVRTACRSRRAGLLAGLAYVLSFWHFQQVLVMGRLPVCLVYALLPWPFYGFERLRLPGRRLTAAAWGGIGLGLLAFAHPGYAFWGTVFLVLYMGIRLGWQWQVEMAKGGALLLGVGLLFGAYLTAPMWLERGHTTLAGGFVLQSVPDPSWRQLLSWSNHWFHLPALAEEDAHWYGGYLGLSVVGLALVGMAGGAKRRRNGVWLAGVVGVIGALWLVFGIRLEPLRSLPAVQAFNAARYLLFALFFLALLCGVGAKRVGRKRGFTWVLLALVFDLGPTTLQQPYLDVSVYADELLERLREKEPAPAAGELPSARLLTTVGRGHPYLVYSWSYFKTGIPSPQADPGKLLPAAELFANPFGLFLDRALRHMDQPDERRAVTGSQLISAGLQLLQVRHVLADQENGTIKRLSWRGQSPVIVSSSVAGYPRARLREGIGEAEIDRLPPAVSAEARLARLEQAYPVVELIREMEVDARSHTCERILLEGYAGTDDLGTAPAVRVEEHRVWNQRVEMRVRVSAACYARLAYARYPHLEVRVDGQVVDPLETAGGFICLPLEEGAHEIVLEARLSPLRRGLLVLDLLLLSGAVWVSVREKRK